MSALAVVLVALWTLSPLLWLLVAGPLVIMVLYARRMSGLLERLRELDRLKDEFVATASHELRPPLASVYEPQRPSARFGLPTKSRTHSSPSSRPRHSASYGSSTKSSS